MFNKLLTNEDYNNYFLEETLLPVNKNFSPYRIKKLNEETKKYVTNKVITKLFNDIKSKTIKMDFSVIEKSKGNVEKLPFYGTIYNGLLTLKKMKKTNTDYLNHYIDELDFSFNTLKKYKKAFELGFKLNNQLIIYLYDSIVIAVTNSMAILISSSLDLFNDSLGVKKADLKNQKTNNHFIQSLEKFNKMEKNKKLKEYFNQTINYREELSIGFMSIIGIVGLVLLFIRDIIFFVFNQRIKFANYLKQIKFFVEINSNATKLSKDTKQKQKEWAEKLGKLADLINVDANVSQERAKYSIEMSDRELGGINQTTKTGDDFLF